MTVDPAFDAGRLASLAEAAENVELQAKAREFLVASVPARYSYNFDWLGLPIIQYPADVVAVQQLLWEVRPAVVVETGVARGGSLVLSASILQLLGGDGIVVGIDIDIRPRNRSAIEAHPLAHRIRLVEGSSVDPNTMRTVVEHIGGRGPVVVLLDSNHTHDHVRAELKLYSPLVTAGSYLVVFDTLIEDMPASHYPDRTWGPGDNPLTALHEFLAGNDRFEIDAVMDARLLVSVARNGYLRCLR